MTSLDWIVPLRDIPRTGATLERTFDGEERARLAQELDILSVDSLTMSARLTPRSGGRYRLAGKLKAGVTQACVISLDPVPANIACELDIEFVPAGAEEAQLKMEATESLLEEQDTDEIEPGGINLGRIVYEELATSLDPFPRHPDVALERTEAGDSEADKGPFAALARLKDQNEKR
ncbi:MAG: DUF177 domain-containing protein [Hyphomicrobiaceae bacterium]